MWGGQASHVEEKQLRLGQHGGRQGHALALPTAQVANLLTQEEGTTMKTAQRSLRQRGQAHPEMTVAVTQ